MKVTQYQDHIKVIYKYFVMHVLRVCVFEKRNSFLFLIFLPPATKLRQGYVFTPVCQSFCSRGFSVPAGVSVQGGLCPGGLCPGGSLSRRGSLSRGVTIEGGLCLGGFVQKEGFLSRRGVSVQEGSLSRGASVQGVSVQGVYVWGGVSVQGVSLRETPPDREPPVR